jgi:DNA-binding NarL/FixJ family response regulator
VQSLSVIERAIIFALAEGKQSKEIATHVERSRGTVEFHIRVLYAKLEARSRAQIVARAFEEGILHSK